MRALLIVNPHATATTARRRDLLAHALASRMKLRIAHTTGRGHAAELAARAAGDGFGLVVVHAGDGTVNETVNGLMQNPPGIRRPVLGVVPGGSTNVFARAVGLAPDPTDATEQILEALSARRTRTVSLGRADGRYFTFNAGLGLDAEVVAQVEKHRAAGSTISNAMHVRELLKLYARGDRGSGPLRLEIAGRPPVDGGVLAFVSNVDPWSFLGSRPVRTNPRTSLDGGLGVFALRSLALPTALRVGSALLRRNGDPRGRQVIRYDDVPSLRISSARPIDFQVDGDYLGKRTQVVFSSIPDALRVLV
jgi:diacylglycerol kinase family enzyme